MRITKGEFKGQGNGDLVIDLLKSKLTDYNHRHSEVNLKRLFFTMKQQKKVCSIGAIRNSEREKILHFSIPALFRPGLSVITIIGKQKPYKNGQAVSLADLLNISDLTLGVVADRSYSPGIDVLIAEHGKQKNIFAKSGKKSTRGLLKMLIKERIDYIIEYPSLVRFLSDEMNLKGRFDVLSLKEAPDLVISHVVCPRNSWGKKIIGQVDQILLKERPTPPYRMLMKRWVDSKNQETFKKMYSRFLQAK